VDHAEDRRVGADAQRQYEHDQRGKACVLADHPQRIPAILQKVHVV
jgi:hypothetical protein